MNFEVFCFNFVNDSLQIVQKEYFDSYNDALKFEQENQDKYIGINITPMNKFAENEMRGNYYEKA